MKNLFETVDNQKFFTLNEAKVTDYIGSDRLGEIISTNPILSTFNDCEPIEGMVLKMTGDMGVSYYKVIKNDDYEFEAYLIDQSGRQLGDAFPLENLELDEVSSNLNIDSIIERTVEEYDDSLGIEIEAMYGEGQIFVVYSQEDGRTIANISEEDLKGKDEKGIIEYVKAQIEEGIAYNKENPLEDLENDYEESGEDITESFEDNNESYYGQIIVDALNSGKIDQEVFIQNVLDWMTEVDAGNFLRDTGWYNDLVDEDGDEEDIEESEEPVTDKSLVDRGVCPYCTGPITKEEYHIYGMCGTCWDNGVE